GVVLYEMAAGELPFKGRNQYELTAAILRSPAAPFPAHVPPILRTIVMRCLAKDPAQRYQRAGEARAALEAVQSDVHATLPSVAAADSRPRWAWLGGAALVGAAALAAWLFLRPSNPWERSAVEGRLTKIGSSDNRTFDPALSADGRMLAYIVETSDGRSDLYTARVSGGARVRLTDDDAREETPRFSPDGERIAFTRRDGPNALPEVRVLPALGGDVIAKVARASHPAWSPDGRQLACITRTDEGARMALAVSAVDGSDTRVLLWSDSVYPFLRSPTWSPDGRSIALVRGTGGIAAELWMVPAAGGEPRLLIDEPAAVFSDAPSFTSDGRGIVHASNRGGATNIWFLPLSGGPPVRLTTGAGPDESPSVAADGTVAFVNSRWRSTLELHDLAAGTSRTLLSHSPFVWAPVFSRDGREIAFSRSEVDGTWHIWTMPAEGGAARQLTSGEAGEVYPRYAPDGQTLFFHTWNAPRRIARLPLGERIPTLLSFDSQQGEAFADVSPDGRSIAFTRPDGDAERIYIASIDGGPARLLSPSAGTVPRWSPDGSRLAFSANRSYAGGIFVIGSDGTGERRLTGDGGWPVWWPDGRIGYNGIGAHGNQEIRIVSLDGQVETLDTIKLIGSNHPFSLSPDGHRLVVSNGVHVSDEIWLLEPPR
ncbi:MAG TPA: hypothetical protein VLD67_01575, partial [Vicinamibacterales bacterium]|nr:hypothetical protein [Vicinamibacterales bacterium]